MLLLSMDGLVVAGSVIMCVWISFVGEHTISLQTQNSPDLTSKSLRLVVVAQKFAPFRDQGARLFCMISFVLMHT